ncbi:hypothetical protein [Aquabacterium tepidiphilum]|uniref:hypothetical protein n=1 Tax=Caldimonas tepidiphila TaxID=2315841 RepID=UPI0013003964
MLAQLRTELPQRAALVLVWALRIARRLGFQQPLKRALELGILDLDGPAPAACLANSPHGPIQQLGIELAMPALDGLLADPGDPGHELHSATAELLGLQCGVPAALLLVEAVQ